VYTGDTIVRISLTKKFSNNRSPITKLNCTLITLLFSWYIKPLLVSETFFINVQFSFVIGLLLLLNFLVKLILTIVSPVYTILLTIKTTSFLSIFMGIKFVILIGLLIVVRGGIPRYRYDFLTKLGWIKTLSLVLVIFLVNLLLSYL
jgi:NADH:ubiquinone oxidoreductase subunit H